MKKKYKKSKNNDKNHKKSKIVKNDQPIRNLEKLKKISIKHFLHFFFHFYAGKKCYPLSFLIIGGRDWTKALQSTPFQISGGGGSTSVSEK